MSSNSEHSKTRGQSSHSVHSSHSLSSERKEETLRSHSQLRHQAIRPPSSNPNRLSLIPSPHKSHGLHNHMAYPPRDPSHHSHRSSMVHTFEPNAFRRSHSDNLPSMRSSRPSSQAFTTRDQTRDPLQSYPKPVNGRPGSNPNRASRLPEMHRRPSAEPANLIHSIRDSSYGYKSNSTQVDSKRVVTGILQSALPPSARPPPVDTVPQRSMPIAELEKRHKAALQKLQAHNNHSTAKAAPPAQPKPVKPRPKSTLQINQEPLPVASPKSEKVDKAEKPLNVPPRRHFFSFGSFSSFKEKSKPSKPAEEPVKTQNNLPSKKNKEPSKATSADVEAEDEDVPLAQLRDRRASYNAVLQTANARQSQPSGPMTRSTLSKSFSVPVNVNKLDERETLDLSLIAHDKSHARGTHPPRRPKYSNSENHPVAGNQSHRASRNLESVHGLPDIDKPSALTTRDKLVPEPNRPASWFQANFDPSEEEKHGPRPLIFEDEAKAIRNSKRLWLQ